MTLRLHAAAHDAERFPRYAIFRDEPGADGVKWTLARRVNVRMLRIHREKFATVLKHEAKAGNNNAAAHTAVIALDERDHVSFIIGGTQVNRVALIQRRIS